MPDIIPLDDDEYHDDIIIFAPNFYDRHAARTTIQVDGVDVEFLHIDKSLFDGLLDLDNDDEWVPKKKKSGSSGRM